MVIESEPKASFGILVGVMDAAIQVGIQRIQRKSQSGGE